jgi:hypothetical protein
MLIFVNYNPRFLNMRYLTSRILHLVDHFIELVAKIYQMYSKKMTFSMLKHIGVTHSLNNLVTCMRAFVGTYLIQFK